MMSSFLEAMATPFFAMLDFALAAPLTAAGTLAAMALTAAGFYLI